MEGKGTGTATTDSERASLDRLRELFLQDLKRYADLLDDAAADLERLRTLAHRLKGSAALYGLSEISRAAAALEVHLHPSIEGSPLERSTQIAELTDVLAKRCRGTPRR